MALKKSELYSSIWQACDQLRGGMDASQYKDYVLKSLEEFEEITAYKSIKIDTFVDF